MGIIILKILAAILVPLLISIAYLALAERKVYIQCRKGPNVVTFSRWVKVIHFIIPTEISYPVHGRENTTYPEMAHT